MPENLQDNGADAGANDGSNSIGGYRQDGPAAKDVAHRVYRAEATTSDPRVTPALIAVHGPGATVNVNNTIYQRGEPAALAQQWGSPGDNTEFDDWEADHIPPRGVLAPAPSPERVSADKDENSTASVNTSIDPNLLAMLKKISKDLSSYRKDQEAKNTAMADRIAALESKLQSNNEQANANRAPSKDDGWQKEVNQLVDKEVAAARSKQDSADPASIFKPASPAPTTTATPAATATPVRQFSLFADLETLKRTAQSVTQPPGPPWPAQPDSRKRGFLQAAGGDEGPSPAPKRSAAGPKQQVTGEDPGKEKGKAGATGSGVSLFGTPLK